jgi:hypothetical protein
MTRSEVAAAAPAVPRFDAPSEAARQVAVWSLRALLAVVVISSFGFATPRAPQQILQLALGERALGWQEYGLGWLAACGTWAVTHAFGLGGLAALGAVSLVGTLALVEARARARSGEVLALLAATVAALTLLEFARVGGGAATWFWAAAFVFALDAAPRRAAWLALPIAVAWCNFAPSGVLAPGIALLVALGRTLDDGRAGAAVRRTWWLVLGAAVMTLATPAGFAYPLHAFAALHLDGAAIGLIPLAPSAVAAHWYKPALLTIVLGAAALWPYRRSTSDMLLTGCAFVLVLINGAMLPLLGIVAGPALAAAARRRAPALAAPPRPSEKRMDFAIAALAFALAAGFAAWVRTAPLGSERQDPQILIARLGANGVHHVLYCTPVTWCDDAAPYGNIRVLVDDRVENATAAQLDAQQKIAHVRPGWRAALRDSGADAILVERESPLAQMLPAQNGWTIGLADDTAALYMKAAGSR